MISNTTKPAQYRKTCRRHNPRTVFRASAEDSAEISWEKEREAGQVFPPPHYSPFGESD